MKIRKVLIVPSQKNILLKGEPPVKSIARRLRQIVKNELLPYNAELLWYADMPKVLGRDNTFVWGKYHPHLMSKRIPENCAYPSLHGTPKPTFIKDPQKVIRDVDALFVTCRFDDDHPQAAISLARQHNIPIAMFDIPEHESYSEAYMRKHLYRGHEPGKDFDVYYKRDLPLGWKTKTLLPLFITPVRLESLAHITMEKKYDLYYRGRSRMRVAQPERQELVKLINKHFPNALVALHNSKENMPKRAEYWREFNSAKMLLSPSGKNGDNYRLGESAMVDDAPLVMPKPWVEQVSPELKDGVNSILYDVIEKNGKMHLADPNATIEKIRYYLDNPAERKRLAQQWRKDVIEGHTTLARARYMIHSLEKALS